MTTGPCKICGDMNYCPSTSGPHICPRCACHSPEKILKIINKEKQSLIKERLLLIKYLSEKGLYTDYMLWLGKNGN